LTLRAVPQLMIPLTLLLAAAPPPVAITILIHLIAFFVTALMCHGELAHDRPSTDHLTEFYLWMAFGGTLGGVFNTLVAPRAFTSLAEYPLVVVAACLLRGSIHPARTWFTLTGLAGSHPMAASTWSRWHKTKQLQRRG